jgi:hypothetical protein
MCEIIQGLIGITMLKSFGLILALLLSANAVPAQPRIAANVFFILDTHDIESTRAAVNAIAAEGGRVDHVFPPNAIIGYVPLSNMSRLRALVPILVLRTDRLMF